MNVGEKLSELKLQALYPQGENLRAEVQGCYIGDLLSNVMANAKAGDIWLTVQTHQNVVAVALLLNIAAIVFVEGHQPKAETVDKAIQENIPLFTTEEKAYQLACRLWELGLGRERP